MRTVWTVPDLTTPPATGVTDGWLRVYATVYVHPDGRIVVCGRPEDFSSVPDTHNCDAMGCGSVSGHVVLRLP